MAKQLTEKQFLKHPRAKKLREICLDIADTVDRLLHQPNVVKVDEYAHLEQLNGRLLQMGITAQCKSELDESAYDDPLIMAEYVAE